MCFGVAKAEAQDVKGAIDCKEIGRLNGQVQYRYDVTMINTTAMKLIVNYNVILFAGDVPQKHHVHSTLMTPHEKLYETHDGIMSVTDWDKVTRFRVEFTAQPTS